MRWHLRGMYLIEEAHVTLQTEVDMDILNENEVVQRTAGTVRCTVVPDEVDCDA